MLKSKVFVILVMSLLSATGAPVFADGASENSGSGAFLSVTTSAPKNNGVDAFQEEEQNSAECKEGSLFAARFYEDGLLGFFKDDRKAAKKYLNAAWQGKSHAQFKIAWMFAAGKGVIEDNQEAYIWLTLAGQSDYQGITGTPIKEMSHVVAKLLDEEQRQQANEETKNRLAIIEKCKEKADKE